MGVGEARGEVLAFRSTLLWENREGARGLLIRDDVSADELRRLAQRELECAAGIVTLHALG